MKKQTVEKKRFGKAGVRASITLAPVSAARIQNALNDGGGRRPVAQR
ncbi:MAG: hypothetical protein IKE66_06715 [Hyphomicrobium sp.]|nr:hypothetical protein [Hyphomicrobium sp.]